MKENDKIKELFKERFESFEAPVDPKIWSGIESSLSTGAPATGVSMLSTKAIIGLVVGVTAVASIGTVSLMNTDEANENRVEVVTTSNNVEIVTNEFLAESQDIKIQSTSVSEDMHTTSELGTVLNNRNSDESLEPEYNEPIKTETAVVEEVNTKRIEELPDSPDDSEREKTEIESSTEVVSHAPVTIDVEEQSRAQAYPAGGVAPLNVSFSSVGEVDEIKWKFDDGTESSELNPDHEFEKPGIYFVTMLAKLKDGTVVMDKAVVEVKEATSLNDNPDVEISSIGTIGNYFTPNGDGENDAFIVKVKGIQSYSISIYAVNGQLVYSSNDPNKGWDGNDFIRQ